MIDASTTHHPERNRMTPEQQKALASAQQAVLGAATQLLHLSAPFQGAAIAIVVFGNDPAEIVMSSNAGNAKHLETALATAHAQAKAMQQPRLIIADPTKGPLPNLRLGENGTH